MGVVGTALRSQGASLLLIHSSPYLPALHFGTGQLHQGPLCGPQRPLQHRDPG